MLFNSYEFIVAFFPLTLLLYFVIGAKKESAATAFLAGSSLLFYAYWSPIYIFLILSSIVVNFMIGRGLLQTQGPRKVLLGAGLIFNLGLLCWFKYADFFVQNINLLLGAKLPELGIILPLAISFFTFQQISYLVDCSRDQVKSPDFISYVLFVSFFPQLIAGPIVHHSEMMPQFASRKLRQVNWENIARGLSLFAIGLVKKTLIADTVAVWATAGYDAASTLSLFSAWITTLSYTLQIYFDFSGYTDMAMGVALCFNISLPQNFNSPYKALSIKDFWGRWHMTLSRWLRDYLYIPLGGNRGRESSTYVNLFLTFLLGGFWHGANWTFIAWGALHGLATSVHKAWSKLGWALPRPFCWALTFLFVHITWVFFRAHSIGDALVVLKALVGLNGIHLPLQLKGWLGPHLAEVVHFGNFFGETQADLRSLALLACFSLVAFLGVNSFALKDRLRSTWGYAVFLGVVLYLGVGSVGRYSEFLYFDF